MRQENGEGVVVTHHTFYVVALIKEEDVVLVINVWKNDGTDRCIQYILHSRERADIPDY